MVELWSFRISDVYLRASCQHQGFHTESRFPFVVKFKLFAVNLISFKSYSLSCPSTLPLLNIRLAVC